VQIFDPSNPYQFPLPYFAVDPAYLTSVRQVWAGNGCNSHNARTHDIISFVLLADPVLLGLFDGGFCWVLFGLVLGF
jgi:hypothetical protein